MAIIIRGNIIIVGNTIIGNRPPYIPILMSVGYDSSFIIRSNKLWGWGNNFYGQLGDNTTVSKLIPVAVLGTNKTFCQISSGHYDIIGIDLRGKLWGWGYNVYGQLGDNTRLDRCTPVAILGTNKTFCQISCEQNHSSGLDFRGKAWCWGYNNNGQLGDNTIVSKSTPVAILGTNKTFCKIFTGQFYTIGLDFRGKVWSWGYNLHGQLGDNTIDNKYTPVAVCGNKTFCQISAGNNHSLGIDLRGKLWCWGRNETGQLGDNTLITRYTPIAVCGNKTFCQISGGKLYSLGIDFRGKLWSWGYNYYGQLGDSTISSKTTPVAVYGNKTFCQISARINHSLGIDFRGKLWGWGYNNYGQLISTPNKSTPIVILGTNKTFCQISGGDGYSIGIDFRGKTWSWGNNLYGQLGDNTLISEKTPVTVLGANKTFCQISAGRYYSIGLDFRGKLWCWGLNNTGQLGDNSSNNKSTPIAVCGNLTFCKISSGYGHSLGIDLRGKSWSWGYNSSGQLGDNTTVNKSTPIAILGTNKTFCQISAGDYAHSLGLDFRGKVWSWGYNLYGQLGDNTVTSRNTPVSIQGGDKTFCKISSGYGHSLGIDLRGKSWSWGFNSQGQLGDNTTVNKSTPIAILGTNKTFCQISAGSAHSLGLDFRGKVWSWGFNYYGQLGDNSTSFGKRTPVDISGSNKTFCEIFAGDYHSMGIDLRGKLWSWGYNFYGQLGNGESMITMTPKLINI